MAVEDGANSRYDESKVKVLHLLKQPTEDNALMSELVDDIVRAGKLGGKFMYRLALRSYALQNGCLAHQETRKISKQDLGNALQQSAIVNLENEKLARSTDKKKVFEFAERNENKERWHGKILKLQPHFVVCGGTFGAVRKALGSPKNQGTTETGMDYFREPGHHDIVYLDMCHPSARYPLAMQHTYLVESAKELCPEFK